MFTIGDFASHGRVSVRMLGYCDATGLLRPARVDPASGYRFCEAVRLARLNRIIALKTSASPWTRCTPCWTSTSAAARDAAAAPSRAAIGDRCRYVPAGAGRGEAPDHRVGGRHASRRHPGQADPAVRVAELTATAARLEPASINPVIQPLYRELGERLGQAGLTPAGPATSYYEDVPDGDGVIVHAALPVNADPGSAHGFEITDLPEITQAATILHRGPMDNVMVTIQTLARWIDENGYRSSGHVRELTLECPDDPDKWVTELQEPITPA